MRKIILQNATASNHGSEMEPTTSFEYIPGKISSHHSLQLKTIHFFPNKSLENG